MEMEMAEKVALSREIQWFLETQAHKDMENISSLLKECMRYFPLKSVSNEESLVKPEKFILTSPQTDRVKCVLTLLGDQIHDADMTFRLHKNSEKHSGSRTCIYPDHPWRLKQLGDCGNLVSEAKHLSAARGTRFCSLQELTRLVEAVSSRISMSHARLGVPRRRTLSELQNHSNMHALQPGVSSEAVISFYIHATRLVLAVYELQVAADRQQIRYKHQVECSVPWLADLIALLSLAQKACNDLKDKVLVFSQYDVSDVDQSAAAKSTRSSSKASVR